MMHAQIYFSPDTGIRELVDALLRLPGPLAPARFSESEGRAPKANRVSDGNRFSEFVKKHPLGFFLFTEDRSLIDISTTSSGRGHAWVSLSVKSGDPALAEQFLCVMAEHDPIFGYAGELEERDHRNYKIQHTSIPRGSIKSYVGRDLGRYVSGVYWQTLLSTALLDRHGIDIDVLRQHAVSMKSLGGGAVRMLKFFDDPGGWRDHADRLDDLCENTPGIFSRRILDAETAGVTEQDEYLVIERKWE